MGSSLVATETSGGSPVRLEANPAIFECHCRSAEIGLSHLLQAADLSVNAGNIFVHSPHATICICILL